MDEQWWRLIYRKTRSRAFLWKLGLGIIAFGVLVGFLLNALNVGKSPSLLARIQTETLSFSLFNGEVFSPDSGELFSLLKDAVQDPQIAFDEFLSLVPSLSNRLSELELAEFVRLLGQRFGEQPANLLNGFHLAIATDSDAALQGIVEEAQREPPTRWANQTLAELAYSKNEYGEAYLRFKMEGRHPDAEYARERAISILLLREDFEELALLKDDPLYKSAFSSMASLQIAIHSRDWMEIARLIPATQFVGKDFQIYLIAGVVALVWFILLLQLGQVRKDDLKLLGLCLAGFFLGVISIAPTLFLVILQDEIFNFERNGDWIQVFAYYIGGVGLREEFCKLLLFLPLAPIVAKRRNELDMLIVASFVGLGFAAEENLSYFDRTSGLSATARFLTANFFHITLTGAAGLYLCRVWRQGMHGFNEFLYAFGIIVVLHGCYNAFLSVAEIQEGGFIAMALFILLSKYYFAEVHSHRHSSEATVSMTSVFVIGLSLLVAAMIAYQASLMGTSLALKVVIPELLGSAIILFMFFREFGESIGA